MNVGSLFSGIGGLEMGLEMCGVGPVIWQCDSDPYARAVLAQHWPFVRRYNNVREIDERAERPDVICGGFPCQDISNAGKRVGITGERSGLWSEFARIIRDLRPRIVFVENVAALTVRGLDRVLGDLAALGFDAEWDVLRAADAGAPHLRARLFLFAYTNRIDERLQPRWIGRTRGTDSPVSADDGANRSLANSASVRRSEGWSHVLPGQPDAQRRGRDVANTDRAGWRSEARNAIGDIGTATTQQGQAQSGGRDRGVGPGATWPIEPDVGRVAHGVSSRSHRLRLLGNAVVPAQAALAWRTLTARAAREAA